jgi:hypothetical protein
MSMKTSLIALAAALSLGLLTACSMLSPEKSFAPSHPETLGAGRPSCSECHTNETMKGGFKTYAAMDHTPTFVKNHKYQANQDSNACASCHAPSFCSDCHGGKVAMNPATKLGDRPDRMSPHRGGYMTLHRLEGKMDPTSCFKCHGRANNDKCTACHR